jgi:hypothetical protein
VKCHLVRSKKKSVDKLQKAKSQFQRRDLFSEDLLTKN